MRGLAANSAKLFGSGGPLVVAGVLIREVESAYGDFV